jgi:hypothetical protein
MEHYKYLRFFQIFRISVAMCEFILARFKYAPSAGSVTIPVRIDNGVDCKPHPLWDSLDFLNRYSTSVEHIEHCFMRDFHEDIILLYD